MIKNYKDIELTIKKPIPIDKEVSWDKSKIIISETDSFGRITEVNSVFCDVSGYSAFEMIGQPHNIVRHPDMPKFIFKMLWDNLKQGNNFVGVIKNLAKSGEYYWVITDFEMRRDVQGNIQNYTARRKAVANEVIDNKIAPLYETMLKLEKIGGIELSSRFFKNYLDKEGKDYIDFVIDIMAKNKREILYEEVPMTPVNTTKEISDEIYALNDAMNEKRKSFFERLFIQN
ncbi:MAG: PAS domain-containing protein [Capnocytophaga sp.]|nr:PAS domain-containing protein [Capnocytophaga sp.]